MDSNSTENQSAHGSPYEREHAQQYAASILVNEGLTQSMFAEVLENEAQNNLCKQRIHNSQQKYVLVHIPVCTKPAKIVLE